MSRPETTDAVVDTMAGATVDTAVDTSAEATPATPATAAPWRAALDAAIAADPQGKLGVALRLGVSRPYVSRITTGHIPEASPRFIQRVVDTYLQVDCPHLQRSLPPGQCRSYAQLRYSEITADQVPHWRACRRCPRNPELLAPTQAGVQP
jgi:hypothetical protein